MGNLRRRDGHRDTYDHGMLIEADLALLPGSIGVVPLLNFTHVVVVVGLENVLAPRAFEE